MALLSAIMIIVLAGCSFQETDETEVVTVRQVEDRQTETVTVQRVIDGDTSQLRDGRDLRYLDIDAPEVGHPNGEEAKFANNRLVEGKMVRLEFGRPRQGKYDRSLAYVFVDDTFVNEALLRQGHAYLRPDAAGKYRERLCQAQEEALAAGVGIWERSPEWETIRIVSVHANAAGHDRQNLNDEFIVIENQSQRPVDFNGWSVSDPANHRYLFSHFTLAPKAQVTLRTGLGVPSERELFWASRTPVWNNKGDAIFIRDRQGHLVLSHAYGDASCRTNP